MYDELPELYARGLRLHRTGGGAPGIAARPDIEHAAVPSLRRRAEAKLARIVRDSDPSGSAV